MGQLHLLHPRGQVYLGNNIINWGVKVLLLWKIINRKWKSLSHVQLFVTPWTCSLPGSSVHGVFQAKTLEWVAIPFSRGPSWPRDWTRSLALQEDSLPSEPPGKPQLTERAEEMFSYIEHSFPRGCKLQIHVVLFEILSGLYVSLTDCSK